MDSYLPAVMLCALFTWNHQAATTAGAQQPYSAAGQSIVVLRNGSILQGSVTYVGDFVLIAVGDDDEIRMPVSQVEFACGSLEEAYYRKRDNLRRGDVRERLRLAYWCLRHELVARAADQLLAARSIDPDHPGVAAIDRRLTFAALPTPRRSSSSHPAKLASQDQVDQVIAKIDRAAIEEFTASVQPLLLNSCASGACHGRPTSLKYQLFRPVAGKILPRRLTQQNLLATWRQLDPANLPSSPLLTVPTRPHGQTATPVFGPQQQLMFHKLAAWAEKAMSLKRTGEPTEPGAGPQAETPFQPRSIQPPSGAVLQSSHPAFGGAPPAASGDDSRQNEPLPSKPPQTDRLQNPTGAAPRRDPFDPEVFNRRYLDRRANQRGLDPQSPSNSISPR